MNKLHKIKVVSMEPSSKYEGKWICQLYLDGSRIPNNYWMSHKQMTSLQKNMDKPVLYGAFDYTKDKARFIWASDSKEWLSNAFKATDANEPPPASFETVKSHVDAFKRSVETVTITDEELPF